MEGKRWRVQGRAAEKTRSEYYDPQHNPVVEFDLATDRMGETMWIRAICTGSCARLAKGDVKKGTQVVVEGKVEDKGEHDSFGRYKRRLVMWVEKLIVGEAEAVDASVPDPSTSPPRAPSAEEEALRFAKHMEEHPLRWRDPKWQGELPAELQADRDAWLRGERESPDPEAPVSPDDVRRLVNVLAGAK